MEIPKQYCISTHSQAPIMLQVAMAKFDDLLKKSEANGAKPEALKFYKYLMETMLFSYKYMMDVYWIIDRNNFLASENTFLKKWAGEQMHRLELYEGLREMITTGELDPMMKTVQQAIDQEFSQGKV